MAVLEDNPRDPNLGELEAVCASDRCLGHRVFNMETIGFLNEAAKTYEGFGSNDVASGLECALFGSQP